MFEFHCCCCCLLEMQWYKKIWFSLVFELAAIATVGLDECLVNSFFHCTNWQNEMISTSFGYDNIHLIRHMYNINISCFILVVFHYDDYHHHSHLHVRFVTKLPFILLKFPFIMFYTMCVCAWEQPLKCSNNTIGDIYTILYVLSDLFSSINELSPIPLTHPASRHPARFIFASLQQYAHMYANHQ